MKNSIAILILFMTFACAKHDTSNKLSYSHLARIDSLINIKNLELSDKFDMTNARNPAVTSVFYSKSLEINEMLDEFQKVLLKQSKSQKVVVEPNLLIKAIYEELDKLQLDTRYANKLKDRYLKYWYNKNLKPPVRLEDALSLIIDLKLLQYDAREYIFNQIKANYYSFNVIKPIIVDNNTLLKVGDTYEAKIGLTSFDTTFYHIVKVDNKELNVVEGFGIYKTRLTTPGKKTFKGYILYWTNSYKIDTLNFEHSYIVR